MNSAPLEEQEQEVIDDIDDLPPMNLPGYDYEEETKEIVNSNITGYDGSSSEDESKSKGYVYNNLEELD